MSQFNLQDLIYLMSRLRDPDGGCPWDLQQDFASIVPHTLEEAYEVADTIEREDWSHLKDELGDLLFQVIFYAQLGRERSLFDMEQIIDQLVSKLVRRHPHVFPEGQLRGESRTTQIESDQVNRQWEAIKSQEREQKSRAGVLDEVPIALPALSRAAKLQKRAAGVGFDWADASDVLDKIEEEIAELRQAMSDGNDEAVADEMGDLLFAQVNLARKLGVNAEQAVRATNSKFEQRFNYIEAQVRASGKPWSAFTLEQLDHWWDQAKQLES